MPSLEPFLIYTRKLEELGLRYMVSGSIAAIYYGEPRMTNDVDIIVFLSRDDAGPLERAFPHEQFYCPPLDIIQLEAARPQRGHFNLIHHDTGFKADIYLGGSDSLHAWGMANARLVTIDSDRISLAPPEYVIIRKLEFHRDGRSPKHLRDVLGIVHGMGPDWNREPLQGLIDARGLEPEWQAALASDG